MPSDNHLSDKLIIFAPCSDVGAVKKLKTTMATQIAFQAVAARQQ
jgi:hypothetical protein